MISFYQLGHDVPPERQLVATDAEWKEMRKRIDHHSKVYGTMYAKVTECVLFHKDILRYELGQLIVPFKKLDPTFHSFGDEVQDIFQGSIFAQVCASVIIICMTLLQATGDDVTMADLLGCGFYLLVMTSQVFIFCYVGNEISYTVGWTRRGIKCLGRISIPNSMMFRYRRINLQSLLGFPTTSSSISVPAKQ